MVFTGLSPSFLGQPAAGTLFMGSSAFSVLARVEVPLVMKRRRGSWDLSSRGTKVDVMIWVPTTLTFQEALHAWRIVRSPARNRWSNCAPGAKLMVLHDWCYWVLIPALLTKASSRPNLDCTSLNMR